MVIYTNNLAEKLFGFAMSRDQLKNTGLCDILQDPNLQLDIDLAIDFNASIRGDEEAAERFTNTLILSSAFLDYSTADFYTTRMEQYPVFEYHIDRITYIFGNIDNINDYYAAASARDKNFIDSLKNALKDCLNSPCNLFAASSESIAAATDYVAASNSTTIPPFAELKDLVRTTYGGIKNTLVKQLPDAVSSMVGKVAILGQDAFNQSIDVMFEKDKEKKDKLIANALAGKALDYDTTGYTYVPDIESFTSIEGFAASVLSQAASDLGGCFRKYQHLARYSPYDPEQNLGRASTSPIQDSADGKSYNRMTTGLTQVGGIDRAEALNCNYGLSEPDIAPPGTVGKSELFSGTQKEYYTKVYNAVYAAAVAKGLPNPEVIARLGAAQSSLETGYGKSMPAGSNNAFGIKGTGPAGSVNSRTGEVINGQYVNIRDNFRAYNSFEESATDYVDFLIKNKRYKPVLASTNIDSAIGAIGRSGYATDPLYGLKVKSINDKF